jgi:hypothetical protein
MTLRIYVADLAAYNAGTDKGDWVDLDGSTTEQEILDSLIEKGMLGKYNEYAIHEYENFEGPQPATITEAQSIAKAYKELSDETLWALYCEWCIDYSYDVAESVEKFEEAFRGLYADVADYAYEQVKECGDIDEDNYLFRYIDWEKLGREMEIGGDIFVINVSYEIFLAHHPDGHTYSHAPVAIFDNHI